MNKGMFATGNIECSTPQAFFEGLDKEFHFTLDPCSTHENAKCNKYYTKTENGLWKSWGGEVVFMNPPYGREIPKWMRKAYKEHKRGTTVVCLVPARTDTKWWHNYAMKVWPQGVRLLKGRLKFGGMETSAPFPSAIIVFEGGRDESCDRR
ncbi:adenine methyltransferase [bacterium]|nr:adenine methyltransferase [bacterium]